MYKTDAVEMNILQLAKGRKATNPSAPRHVIHDYEAIASPSAQQLLFRRNRAALEVTLMVLRRTIIEISRGQWKSVKMAVEEYTSGGWRVYILRKK